LGLAGWFAGWQVEEKYIKSFRVLIASIQAIIQGVWTRIGDAIDQEGLL
jgi:hypothetical protein